MENQEAMASELENEGYNSLAFQWTNAALETLKILKEKELTEAARRDVEARLLRIHERQVKLAGGLFQD